jgi:hypothetical protein
MKPETPTVGYPQSHPFLNRYSHLEAAPDEERTTKHPQNSEGGISRVAYFRRKHLLTAWRLVLSSGALAGTLVLLTNIVTLIVVYTRFEIKEHVATIWTGGCKTAANTVSGLHVLINILSTILLASSNFSIQCLSSPTRTEVNRAHAKRVWLNIATPNVRNLLYVSPSKTLLWLVLGLSSFPLHLLWNSAVFETRTVTSTWPYQPLRTS